MNSKQWLIDLESKAGAAMENWDKKYSDESPEAVAQLEATMNHMTAANPAAVMRLVDMLRFLACSRPKSDCPHVCHHEETPDLEVCDLCWIEHAYQLTEPTP